jgi:imidazolonepropionase-like amidohydrolase
VKNCDQIHDSRVIRLPNSSYEIANLFDGDKWHDKPVDILIRAGIIQDIGHNVKASGVQVAEVFAHGHPVTPGLVDMHSHSGVDSLPAAEGFYDLYELSADLTPYVRTIDAIYTSDGSSRPPLNYT